MVNRVCAHRNYLQRTYASSAARRGVPLRDQPPAPSAATSTANGLITNNSAIGEKSNLTRVRSADNFFGDQPVVLEGIVTKDGVENFRVILLKQSNNAQLPGELEITDYLTPAVLDRAIDDLIDTTL